MLRCAAWGKKDKQMNPADKVYSLQIQLRNHQQIKCMQRREDLGRWEKKFDSLNRELQRAQARAANTTKESKCQTQS